MRQLDEFYDYKNRLLEDMLSNGSIVELLLDEGESISSPGELMYKRVFPYEYVPETLEHAYTYICSDVDITRVYDDTFLEATIYIWVFSHKSKLRLPHGAGVRTDKICCEIAEALNGSRFYGLGELSLYSVKRFAPISDYQGKVMIFKTKDFNRLAPNTKPIPSNRKKW